MLTQVLDDVARFMHAGQQAAPDKFPPSTTRELRKALLEEELQGLTSAMGDFEAGIPGSRARVLDDIIDLMYVTLGTAIAYDLQDVLSEAWDRVHKANMAKFGPGGYLREDGKVMKPPGWKAPQLDDLAPTPERPEPLQAGKRGAWARRGAYFGHTGKIIHISSSNTLWFAFDGVPEPGVSAMCIISRPGDVFVP